jgi:hypothetical protein
MLYQITFKNNNKAVITNSLLESVAVINRFIETESILSFPVNRNIVANWTSRSKSSKYNFVDIIKLKKKKFNLKDLEKKI